MCGPNLIEVLNRRHPLLTREPLPRKESNNRANRPALSRGAAEISFFHVLSKGCRGFGRARVFRIFQKADRSASHFSNVRKIGLAKSE
jgi:hypothetical protein